MLFERERERERDDCFVTISTQTHRNKLQNRSSLHTDEAINKAKKMERLSRWGKEGGIMFSLEEKSRGEVRSATQASLIGAQLSIITYKKFKIVFCLEKGKTAQTEKTITLFVHAWKTEMLDVN